MRENSFRCTAYQASGRCFSQDYYQDGLVDCIDKSDEGKMFEGKSKFRELVVNSKYSIENAPKRIFTCI